MKRGSDPLQSSPWKHSFLVKGLDWVPQSLGKPRSCLLLCLSHMRRRMKAGWTLELIDWERRALPSKLVVPLLL